MIPISIVIITKNEAEIIANCINAAKLITDDIIVIDNDSTDSTVEIAVTAGCQVYSKNWDGYGANKNKGIALARYNWILSIDADEVADEHLIRALHEVKLNNPEIVYDIRFKSYFGKKPVNFGTWGRDHHIRLFNRQRVKWAGLPVHETLILPPNTIVKKLEGHLHHYSVKNREEYFSKTVKYARLSAEKYPISSKKVTAVKLYIAPLYHFLRNYVLLLGFLDGREGWDIARTISKYTRLKYRYLKNRSIRQPQEKQSIKENLLVEY